MGEKHGIRLIIKNGIGVARVPTFSAILAFFVSIVDLMGIPLKIARFANLLFFGHLSKIYKKALQEPFDIKVQCGAAVAGIMNASVPFEKLADVHGDSDDAGLGISKQKFQASVWSAFRCSKSMDKQEVERMTN